MRKKNFLPFIFFILCMPSAMAQVKTVTLASFGAKPNDVVSDQEAFNKAAAFINKNGGNVKLLIPAGKYLVGVVPVYKKDDQIPTGKVNDVMALVNCKNVTIEGKGNVEIKFLDNIPIGTLPNRPNGQDSAVHIGSLFRLINSSFITISNIKADGNNEKFKFLKVWGVGTNPYEREHEGLFILNCSNIKVTNSAFCSFGRDGAMILEDADKMPVRDIKFIGCKFNKNGRNGFSWCGGEKVSFDNCTFNFNCTGKIITNPGSGLDVEPERGAVCKNGIINNCEIINNGGYAVTSEYLIAGDIVFTGCKITGNSNYALLCKSPRYRFVGCTIAGTSLLYYDAADPADGTAFISCTFTDSLPGSKVYIANYITGILGRNVQFTGCTFNCYLAPFTYIELRAKKGLDRSGVILFKKCTINAWFKKASTWNRLAFVGGNINFEDCVFKTAGFADFNSVLNEGGRNIYQRNNSFINQK